MNLTMLVGSASLLALVLLTTPTNTKYSDYRSGCTVDWECPSNKCITTVDKLCFFGGLVGGFFSGNKNHCIRSSCAECATDDQCSAGQECKWFKCADIQPNQDECRYDLNCENWEICRQGECKPRSCRTYLDCPQQRQCNRGRCIRRRYRGD